MMNDNTDNLAILLDDYVRLYNIRETLRTYGVNGTTYNVVRDTVQKHSDGMYWHYLDSMPKWLRPHSMANDQFGEFPKLLAQDIERAINRVIHCIMHEIPTTPVVSHYFNPEHGPGPNRDDITEIVEEDELA